jgi:23S rRNA (pseudouridine1915-N3)-methyltransferase
LYEVEERKPLKTKQLVAREAELLSKVVKPNAFIVAVDKTGESYSSLSFAQFFENSISDNLKYITFIIGGAEGLNNSILRQADLILSMGAMTWPHLFARCMLIEQIYRVQCILTNHPYHR